MRPLAHRPDDAPRRRNAATRRTILRPAPRHGAIGPGDRRAERRAARLLDCAESRVRYFEIESIEALIDEAERLGGHDERCLARVLTLRVRIDRIQDRFDVALQSARVAIRLWQSLADGGGESAVRGQVAHILLAVGDSDEALSEGLAAMTLAECANDTSALAEALRVVGNIYLSMSQCDRAAAFCERGIEASRSIGGGIVEGALLDTLGCVYGAMAGEAAEAGDEARARAMNLQAIEASRQAMAIARAWGHRANEATATANVAEGLVHDGRPEEGLSLMESWADYRPEPGIGSSHHLDTWGSICLALGRLDDAVDLFRRAHAAATQSTTAMLALQHAADAYERKGDFAEALAHYKRYHALFRQVTSEKAQRSASVAAVRLETRQAQASADASRSLAEDLQRHNEQLSRRADDLMHPGKH